MNEEPQEGATTEETVDTDLSVLEALSKEDMVAEIKKLRDEAGGRRVRNKELKAEQERQLAEYAEWKKSQMTEVERLTAEKAELEKTAQDLLLEKVRHDAAKKYKIAADDEDLISGSTKEAIEASAKRLAARLATTTTNTNQGLFGGTRGKPVGSGAEADAASAFNNFMRNGS